MNKENILKLADHLETMSNQFRMETWIYAPNECILQAKEKGLGVLVNSCGTAACIAGEAAILFNGPGDDCTINLGGVMDFSGSGIASFANEVLGLPEGHSLFGAMHLDQKGAANVLRNYVRTGELDNFATYDPPTD